MTKEFTGRDVLIWLTGFFLLVIAVNVYFIAVSVATFRGEDEQKPYLQGIEFSRTLERRAQQERQGWSATIDAERLVSGAVRVAVTLKQKDGVPKSHATLIGALRHPADETRDRPLKLVEMGNGEYRAELSGVSPGAWDVVITTPGNATPFEVSRRVWVR